MFEFSERSKHLLSTVDSRLQDIFNEAIKRSPVDFGITSGMRTPEEQLKLFCQGRLDDKDKVTNLDGFNKMSKHNKGHAVDVYVYKDGKAWFDEGSILPVAEIVFDIAREKNIGIKWGGHWTRFPDAPHFELA